MKIKDYLKNKISLYILILMLSPIVDLLIGFIQRNAPNLAIFGAGIRGLLLITILFYNFIIKKENNSKINNYIILILLFMVLFIVINNFVFKEMIGIIKFFFFPLILCCFMQNKEDSNKIKNSIYISGIIYMLLLLIPMLTNTALKTYDYNKMGFTGWFYSPNEISGIVSLMVPFILIKPLEESTLKRKFIYALLSLIYIFTIFTIGTKTPIFAVFITLAGYLLINIIKIFNNKNKVKSNISNFLIIILFILFSIFNFKSGISFSNIILQSDNYQNFAEILQNNKEEIIDDSDNNEEIIDDEQISKSEDEKENNKPKTSKILNLIFSSRDIYLIERFELWNKSSIKMKLLGLGQIINVNNGQIHKLIEIDLFDIFFSYGIVGFVIFIFPIFYIILKLIIYFIKNFKLFINNYENWAYYISVVLGILISSIAGHILGAPAVSLILAIITATIYRKIDNIKMIQNKYISRKRVIYIILLLMITILLAIVFRR